MIIRKVYNYFVSATKNLTLPKAGQVYMPTLKLIEINKTEDDEYIVKIQVINKDIFFNIKPEEILAKDNMVDQFSPRDIRALTYLGYLGINGPKYKILAQRFSVNNDKVIFAIKKKGEKNIIINTADEVLNKKEILNSLDAKDAHIIGYTIASESIFSETKTKKASSHEEENDKKSKE